MKNKKPLVLAAIAVLLLIIGVVTKNKPKQDIVASAGLVTMFQKDLTTTSVDRIVVTIPGKENAEGTVLTLAKKGDGWQLPEHFDAKVDVQKLEQMLSRFAKVRGEFRSESEAVMADYKLDAKHATRIVLYKGDKMTSEVWLGRNADNRTHFARKAGSHKVYVINDDLRSTFGASSSDLHKAADHKRFMSLKLLDFKKADVTSIAFNGEELAFALKKVKREITTGKDANKITKEVEEWIVEGDVDLTLKKNGASELLSKLSGLTANDVVDQLGNQSKYGLDTPTQRVEITYKNGKKLLLSVGKKLDVGDHKDKIAVSTGATSIFAMNESSLNRVFVKMDDVFDLSLLKLVGSAITEITVKGKDAFTLSRKKKDGSWTLKGLKRKEKVDSAKIVKIVNGFAKLSSYGFKHKSARVKAGKRAIIKANNGNKFVVAVSNNLDRDDTYLATVTGVAHKVLIKKTTVEELFPKRRELLSK